MVTEKITRNCTWQNKQTNKQDKSKRKMRGKRRKEKTKPAKYTTNNNNILIIRLCNNFNTSQIVSHGS